MYIPQGHTVILYLTACTVRCNIFKALYIVFFSAAEGLSAQVRTYAHVNPSVSLHVCLCAFSLVDSQYMAIIIQYLYLTCMVVCAVSV